MTDACALVQENRCEEVYEKKCAINMTEVTGDEEVTSCSRPLYRRCGDTNTSGLVRRRRDTLQQHIQSLARVLADTLAPAPAPGTRDPLVTGTDNIYCSLCNLLPCCRRGPGVCRLSPPPPALQRRRSAGCTTRLSAAGRGPARGSP